MSDSWIKNLSNVEKYAKLFLRHKTGVFKSRYKYFSRNELKTIRLEKCRFSFLGYKIRTLCSRESFTAVSYTFDELEPSTCIQKIFNAAGDLYSGEIWILSSVTHLMWAGYLKKILQNACVKSWYFKNVNFRSIHFRK